MNEQLIKQTDVAKRLAISMSTFNRMRMTLAEHGLEHIIIGNMIRYRQSSLDRLIADAAEKRNPIV
jgi:predicted DNA-binding transcriptional regulator AlpA